MRLLLDMHVLLWALGEPARLDSATIGLLEDAENEVFFSAASIWKIAIKARLGRVEVPIGPGPSPRLPGRRDLSSCPSDPVPPNAWKTCASSTRIRSIDC